MHKRVLIWVESYQGSGHLVTAIRLARALSAEKILVDIASSNFSLGGQDKYYKGPHNPFNTILLPGFQNALGIVTEGGLDKRLDDSWHEHRRSILDFAVRSNRYDAVVIESWPFMKSPQHDIELEGLLEAAHDVEARIYCLVRDIIPVNPTRGPEKRFRNGLWGGSAETLVTNLHEHALEVVIRGDNELHPFVDSFERAAEIEDITNAPGYFVNSARTRNDHSYAVDKPVLISSGGWYAGDALRFYTICLAARKHAGPLARNPWLVFVPWSAEIHEFTAIRKIAECASPDGAIQVVRNGGAFERLLPHAALSINAASYNTCLEALACETPFVVVPLATSEQVVRARRLHVSGLAGIASLPTNVAADSNSSSLMIEVAAEMWGSVVESTYALRDRLRHHSVQLNGAQRFATRLARESAKSPRLCARIHQTGHRRSEIHLPPVEALILDWDDTIVCPGDAVALSYQFALEQMTLHGYVRCRDWTLETKRRGLAPYDPLTFFSELFGDATAGEKAYSLQVSQYRELIRNGAVRMQEGAAELLSFCKTLGLPMAVVSNSPQETVALGRNTLLVPDMHDLIVIGTGANRPPKPNPHTMRLAVAAMEDKYSMRLEAPEGIYSIGDSYQREGRASIEMGFTFIRFGRPPSKRTRLEEVNTHATVASHWELIGLLKDVLAASSRAGRFETVHA